MNKTVEVKNKSQNIRKVQLGFFFFAVFSISVVFVCFFHAFATVFYLMVFSSVALEFYS